MVSDRDLIRQFLQLAFQMILAGVIRIRHGGSEESIGAVRRQSSQWVADCFSESADVPDLDSVPRDEVVRHQVSKQTPEGTAVKGEV